MSALRRPPLCGARAPRSTPRAPRLTSAAFLLLGLLAAGCGPAASSTQPIRWAADAEGGAPYIFKDPQDPQRNLGFEVELAAALAKEIGRPIEFTQYSFVSLESGLRRGDFDFVMNGFEVTPERFREFRLSQPYYIYEQQLVVRKDDDRFAGIDDLVRLKDQIQIGTLGNTTASRLLDKHGIPQRVFENQSDPYRDLELGRLDGVLLDLPIAIYYGKPNPALKFAGPPVEPGYYVIAVRKGDEELSRQIDAALTRLVASGELQKILDKWSLWNDAQSQLATARAEDLIPAGQRDVTAESRAQWTFSRYIGELLQGAWLTIEISCLSMALAIALGLPISLSRLYGPRPLQWAAMLYVEFFRGVPVLLLLYFLYYSLPEMAQIYGWGPFFSLNAFTAAVIGFGLNYAAFEAEIYRAGLSAIPVGQWEAGASLGMTGRQTFWRIILPQAVRNILPPMTNDFVALFKDTSIVSIIALEELAKKYQILSKSSLKYLEIGIVTALLYLIMSVPLGYLSRWLEKRWSDGERGT